MPVVWKLALVTILLLMLMPAQVEACNEGELSVIGRIVDADGKGMPEVTVQIYTHSGQHEPPPSVTGENGEYRLCFKEGEEIHALLFDHAEKDPNHVEHLFDENDQTIHLRLFGRNERDKHRWVQLFATLELGWYIYEEYPKNREGLRLKYKKRVAAIEIDPNAPEELQERLKAIRVLYGIQE